MKGSILANAIQDLSFGSEDQSVSDDSDVSGQLSDTHVAEESDKDEMFLDELESEIGSSTKSEAPKQPIPTPALRRSKRTRKRPSRYEQVLMAQPTETRYLCHKHSLESTTIRDIVRETNDDLTQAPVVIDAPDKYRFEDAHSHPIHSTDWIRSIEDEFDSMIKNKFWSVVERPESLQDSDIADNR